MINHCRFKVKADTVFMINLLNYNKIPLKKIVSKNEYTVFCVKSIYKDDVINMLNERSKEYAILKDSSVKTFFKKNTLRFGLYTGLMIVALFMVFYGGTLARVEISGNNLVEQSEIKKVIDKHLELPTFKPKADFNTLTKDIIAIEGISSASVSRKGNTLFVQVYEELPKVDIEDKTVYKDVVSKYDSIITRVVAFSGTCKVKKGDSVKKGQTIISAIVVLDEEQNLTAPTYANGIAYGRVWITKELIIEKTYITAERTGKSVSRVKFFNKADDYKPEFKQYEVEKQTCYLNSVIAIPYTIYTYYETKNVEKEMNFEENEQAIVEKHTNKLFEELPSDCMVIRNWHTTKMLDKKIKLVIYYEIETKIT
ncbi:MAG: hypothetical protein GX242_06015 [Clostridiales bacterium]|nr:hypothetical protein [Clostridiales bacterium]